MARVCMLMMSAILISNELTFMASLLVGSIGIQWSRWYLAHPKVFTVAAVIPVFPGSFRLYRGVSAVKLCIWAIANR